MSGPLVLVGQLLGISFATGLNLYATLAVLGLAMRLGWIDFLSPQLMGLSNTLVIATAGALYLVEFVADKIRYIDTLWDTVHTFIRPPAAALLTLAALSTLPLEIRIAAATLAGLTALAAHGTKAGLRLAINATPGRPFGAVISVLEDAAAIGLAIAALRYPAAALGLAATALLLLALVGPRLWRAFILGIRAIVARLRGFFGTAGWRDVDELPASLRALTQPPEVGDAPIRAARAAIKGARGVGAYRNGWIVIARDTPVFLYRALFRPRRLPLAPARATRLRSGIFADLIEMQLRDRRCILFLLKDGPSAERAAAEIVPASHTTTGGATAPAAPPAPAGPHHDARPPAPAGPPPPAP